MHRAEPAVHHRPAGPQRHPPERQLQPFGLQAALDEVVIANRRPAGRQQDVGAGIAGAPDRVAGRLDLVRHDAEVDDLAPSARASAISAKPFE